MPSIGSINQKFLLLLSKFKLTVSSEIIGILGVSFCILNLKRSSTAKSPLVTGDLSDLIVPYFRCQIISDFSGSTNIIKSTF